MVEDGFDMKTKVLEILDSVGLSEARASKMDHDDFLKLLAAFNQAGIHFC